MTVASDKIARAFNRSGDTRTVTLDRSKCWHAGLLHKLKSYEISGQIFGLILSFLSNRQLEWFLMGILHKITQLMLDLLKAPFLALHFFFYTLILLSILLILLSTLSVIRHLTYGNNYIWLLSLNLIYETVDWARKWLVDFSAGKTQLVSFDHSYSIGAIDVKMDWSAHEKKSSFKMLKLSFSSKLDWGSYIISIAKTASKNWSLDSLYQIYFS